MKRGISAAVRARARSAALAEIDENLVRAELTPTERAEHEAKRKELWEAKAHQSTNIPSSISGQLDPKLGRPDGFAKSTASVTGESKETINRNVRRGTQVCQEARAYAASAMAPWEARKAKERQVEMAGNHGSKTLSSHEDKVVGKVSHILAEKVHVGHATVEKAMNVRKSGVDEIKHEVESGEMTVNIPPPSGEIRLTPKSVGSCAKYGMRQGRCVRAAVAGDPKRQPPRRGF